MSSSNANRRQIGLRDTSNNHFAKLCLDPDYHVASHSVDLINRNAIEYSRLAAPNLVPRTENTTNAIQGRGRGTQHLLEITGFSTIEGGKLSSDSALGVKFRSRGAEQPLARTRQLTS